MPTAQQKMKLYQIAQKAIEAAATAARNRDREEAVKREQAWRDEIVKKSRAIVAWNRGDWTEVARLIESVGGIPPVDTTMWTDLQKSAIERWCKPTIDGIADEMRKNAPDLLDSSETLDEAYSNLVDLYCFSLRDEMAKTAMENCEKESVSGGAFLVVGVYCGDEQFSDDGREFNDEQTAIDYCAIHGESGTCLHHSKWKAGELKLWFDGIRNHAVTLVARVKGGWLLRLPNNIVVGPVERAQGVLR